MTKKQELFSTRDLYLAATLLTLRFNLVNVDYQYEGIKSQAVGYFQFEMTPGLEDAERQYWQGQLSVEPTVFTTNMRKLKAHVTNFYKNPHNNSEK